MTIGNQAIHKPILRPLRWLKGRSREAQGSSRNRRDLANRFHSGDNTSQLEFICQYWSLHGPRPSLKDVQKIQAGFIETHWLLYDLPTSSNSFGKPRVVAFSSDLCVLRIASQIYTRDTHGKYQPTSSVKMLDMFIDEIQHGHKHVAITTRRDYPLQTLTERDAQLNKELAAADNESAILEIARGLIMLEPGASTNPSTAENTDESHTIVTTETSNTTDDIGSDDEGELIDDILVEDAGKLSHISRREASELHEIEEDDPLLKSDSEISGNSAEEEWSDGSSDMLSDEVEDEDQWNDWGNEALEIEEMKLEEIDDLGSLSSQSTTGDRPSLDLDDVESLTSQMEELNDDEVWKLSEGKEIKISGFTVDRGDKGYESDSSEEEKSSIESGYSPSNYSDGASDTDSDYEEGIGKHLDTLIFGKVSREGKQRISISVVSLNQSDGAATFHFTRYVKRSLFDSPPVFHPSKPLLVWPLGDAEILFADYKANTYFTRLLCCSRFQSCHIWVKAHFSRAGEFVHFAALEAQPLEARAGSQQEKGALALSLQVSTHRLSVRKTTRSPPRLTHRTTLNLGTFDALNISSEPYTLHWTDTHLYLTTNAQTLDVVRIELFNSSTSSAEPTICTIVSPFYLPRTVSSRTLHFFPEKPSPYSTRTSSSAQSKLSQRVAARARIIIGSHSAIPSRGILVPKYQIAPPAGVVVDMKNDLGGWKCWRATKVEGEEEKERMNNAGGRLKGKFETFDKGEDCDIVPFLY